jgi:hypothetical protein
MPTSLRSPLCSLLLASAVVAFTATCENHPDAPVDETPSRAVQVVWEGGPAEVRSVALSLTDAGGEIEHAGCLLVEPETEPSLLWTQLGHGPRTVRAEAYASEDCAGVAQAQSDLVAVDLEPGALTVVSFKLAADRITSAFSSSLPTSDGEAPELVLAPAKCSKDSNCPRCQRCRNGRCEMQPPGQDSRNQCGTSNCLTGNCDGKGNCAARNDGRACGTGKICRAGSCTAACSSSSCGMCRKCTSNGTCVPANSGACGSGKVCQNGACVSLCAGKNCGPCRACNPVTGQCIPDNNSTAPCGGGMVCRNGACIPICAGTNCGPCRTCNPTNGQCIPDNNSTAPCGGGMVCRNGACIPICAGTNCGPCRTCNATNGACVPSPPGAPCGGGKVCQNGQCVSACPADCVGPCRACNTTTGVCAPISNGAACGSGKACQNGQCVQL